MKKISMLLMVLLAYAFSGTAFSKECRKTLPLGAEKTACSITESITGYGYCEYIFSAKKGQLLTIVNSSKRADTIIFSPEEKLLSDNEAVELSQDGQYTLRVLFPRALARRDIKESYTLKIELENPVPDVAPRR